MAEQGPSLNDILSQYALKETDLSIKCPREVRHEIAIKLDDWKMIGYSLGFPKEKLTSIGRENETEDLCKVALLDSWSKKEGGGASYLKLADALYRRQRRDLVEFLCNKLLIASRGATAELDRRQQTTSSNTESEAVATRSRTTSTTTGLEETFKCPCGECSLMVYLKNGCPKSRIPYLGMPVNLSVGDKRNLKYALNKDTRKLCESFEHLSNSTCNSLIARDIKLDRLIRVAKIHDKSLQLNSVKSVDEAFTILAESMSFFNHKLLSNIIDQLGDENDKQRLVKYYEEFNLYCKRKIFEVDPDTWEGSERFPEALEGRQLFAVVVSGSMVETVGDTEVILETLADILDIQPAALHIHRIDEGSVILVFSVPSCIADEIFPLPQEKMSLLKAKGITIFIPSISKPPNLESNRAPPVLPSCGDFGAGLSRLHISLDSGFISRTSTGVMSAFLGPSSYGGLEMNKDAQLTQGTGEKGDSSLGQLSCPPVKMDSLTAEQRDSRAKIAIYEQQLGFYREQVRQLEEDNEQKVILMKAQFEAEMLNMSRDLDKLRREKVMWEMTRQTGDEQTIAHIQSLSQQLDSFKQANHELDIELQSQRHKFLQVCEKCAVYWEQIEVLKKLLKENNISVPKLEPGAAVPHSPHTPHMARQMGQGREYYALPQPNQHITSHDGPPDKSIAPGQQPFQFNPQHQRQDQLVMPSGGMQQHQQQHQHGYAGHGGVMVAPGQQNQYQQMRPQTWLGGQQGGGAAPDSSPHQVVHRHHGNQQNLMPQHGMGNTSGASTGMEQQQQLGVATQERGHQRVPSGPQENPLLQGINTEMHNVVAVVGREVDNPELESFSPQAPFDPNLICPMCRQQFRIGEIQIYRQHVQHCHGT